MAGKRDHRIRLDRALSEREQRIRAVALAAAYHEPVDAPDPRSPTPVEEAYLTAIAAFQRGSQTSGFDWMDKGDLRALLRLGRSFRRRS